MWAALDDQLSETRREMDPVARARRLADVLRVLRDLVQDTAAERDRALIELLRLRPNTSSQDLAPELGMTRQRLDQLRVHAAHGGRPPATG